MKTRNLDFETLDPVNWENTRELAHKLVDTAVDHIRDVRDRPVWRDMPKEVREQFEAHVPQDPIALETILDDVNETVLGYPLGNVHPRFWAWYMGTSNFTGAMADFLAAIQGSNLGGANHVAALIDGQPVGLDSSGRDRFADPFELDFDDAMLEDRAIDRLQHSLVMFICLAGRPEDM